MATAYVQKGDILELTPDDLNALSEIGPRVLVKYYVHWYGGWEVGASIATK